MLKNDLPSIAVHAKSHKLVPDKKMGQNFIFDESLCDKIVRESGLKESQIVLEIGPGPAGITRSILKKNPVKLIAIEKDKRCLDLLSELKDHYPNLEILSEDALRVKLSDITNEKIKIIANLPYNIGTELVFRWLEKIELVDSITVMLQKEVVDRIVADPGSKKYGKLSIMCQLVCDCEKLFDVGPEAFHPPPKVTSSIVHIVPKKDIPSKEIIDGVRKITHMAFNARRKMLRSGLKNLVPNIEELLEKAGISPTLRPEDLSLDDYVRLAELLLPLG